MVAIGGITEANAVEGVEAGADAVAVISAVRRASGPPEAATRLLGRIAEATRRARWPLVR